MFAVKCIEIGDSSWENELAATKRIKHDNIVRIIDGAAFSADDIDYVGLVMELCAGDLNEYIIKNNVNLKEKMLYMRDMAGAVQYLHEKKVIHRDLKPQNILLSEGGGRLMCKITDFGISSVQSQDTTYFYSDCGTECYSAPEVS